MIPDSGLLFWATLYACLFKALTGRAPGTLTPSSSLAACMKVLPILTSNRVENYVCILKAGAENF